MAKSAEQRPDLREDLSGASRDNLEALVLNLVENGRVSPRAVINSIREVIGVRVMFSSEKQLSPKHQEALLRKLKARFEKNREIHENIKWQEVEWALRANPEKLWSLQQMEATGGEPDIIGKKRGVFVFGDCSEESPEGRTNVVFNKEAEEIWRKKRYRDRYDLKMFGGNAVDMAKKMRVDLMDVAQYRELQWKIDLDKHSWSWLKTPAYMSKRGVAFHGCRSISGLTITRDFAYQCNFAGAWRAVLMVPKV